MYMHCLTMPDQYFLICHGIKVNNRLNDFFIKQTMASCTCFPLRFCQFWLVASGLNVLSCDKATTKVIQRRRAS